MIKEYHTYEVEVYIEDKKVSIVCVFGTDLPNAIANALRIVQNSIPLSEKAVTVKGKYLTAIQEAVI